VGVILKELDKELCQRVLGLSFTNELKESFVKSFPLFKDSKNLFAFDKHNTVCSVMLFRSIEKSHSELDFLAVGRSFRRQGLAKKMISHLTHKVWLDVHEDNFKALRFYSNAGFDIVGKRPKYYGLKTALLMEKKPS
jgi:ribosomal protein S18 acetylase RimI-like enzyme